jgi:ABC-type transport system substrate-binding protein
MDTAQPKAGPLSRVAVRQAISMAIDKDAILGILGGVGTKATCILPPDMPGYDPTCAGPTFDPAAAKTALSAAGYPNGFTTTLYADTSDPNPAIAASLRRDLAVIGIKVKVVTLSGDAFYDAIESPHKAWVPIFHESLYELKSKRVGGFDIHPVWLYSLRDVYINP